MAMCPTARAYTTDSTKQRTQKLILWGTLVEDMMANDEDFARSTRQRAGRKFTRNIDREALGLSVAEAESST